MCTSQVLLGEVNAGLSTTQVVVKELKASASVQDQMQFLEEVQPNRSVHWNIRDCTAEPFNKWIAPRSSDQIIYFMYGLCAFIPTQSPVSPSRTLQHPALLQCLAQCSEVTPYLLVMEFCPLVGHVLMIKLCLFSPSQTSHYSLSWCIVVWIIHKLPEQLTTSFPFSLRVIWRATCAVVGLLTPRLLTLWSSSEWRVTLPQGLCTSTNTTLYTGAVYQSVQL